MSESVLRARDFAGQHKTSVRVGIIAIVLAALVGFLMSHTARQVAPHTPPVITMVVIQPQKPPPPPPPLPTPKMIVQPKMITPVTRPLLAAPPTKVSPPKAAAPAASATSTSIHGSGPDNFNLAGSGNGGGFLDGGGGGGGGAWSYYSSQLQIDVQQALQKNAITRHVSAGLRARIWVDAGGMVTRVTLDKSSGNAQVDDAVQNQVLADMRLQPPPAGMPMPIVMSLTAAAPL